MRRFGFRTVALAVCLWLLAASAVAAWEGYGRPTPHVMAENRAATHEIHRVRIVNDFQGPIEISQNGGRTWTLIGKVVQPAVRNNPNGYRASGWAETGKVAATATNAIHVKVGHRTDDPGFPEGRGVMISVLPREFFTPPPDYGSYTAADSGIWTNLGSGTYLFSNEWAPFVGDPVYLEAAADLVPVPENYVPRPGDVLVFVVRKPALYPREIAFENRTGGSVTVAYGPGEGAKLIGRVWKPVGGIGRFEGSLYSGNSRVRANHTGVIDVSTAPVFRGSLAEATDDDKGGFQIIPVHHAHSPELGNALTLTQWMIVEGLRDEDPSPDGVAPLFKGYLRPRYEAFGRFQDGPWQRFPFLTGRLDDALNGLTHVKIEFPQSEATLSTEVVAPVLDPLPAEAEGNPLRVFGRAQPGAFVDVFVNGVVRGSGWVGADGVFLAPTQLVLGQNRIEARATDPAGRQGPLSVPVYVLLTRVPVAIDQPRTPTNQNAITVVGTAVPGNQVEILVNGALAGSGPADAATGRFSIAGVGLVEGVNVLRAVSVAADGTRSEPSPPVEVVRDTVKPVFTEIFPSPGQVVTSRTFTAWALVDGTGSGFTPNTAAIKVNGVAKPVTLEVKDATHFRMSTQVTVSADGTHTAAFYFKDAAGNATRVPETGEFSFMVQSGGQ